MQTWSPSNPNLQLAWDSTSLQSVQFCPRYYQYAHLDGWKGSSVDLEFGIYAATAWEQYQKLRLAGKTRADAQREVLADLMKATWLGNGKQWGGRYEEQWRCTGLDAEGNPVPYRNSKGNRAKCPYSHAGAFFPMPAPYICGECGAEIETVRNYLPGDSAKNRQTLVRTVAWYIEEQPEELSEGLRPYAFPDGTPAVELSFKLPLPWQSPYGENYILAGHLDYIGVFGPEMFVVDNKTTTKGLTAKFWNGYSPHMQVDTYDLVGSVMFPDLPLKGVMIDAAQTLAGGSRFARKPYYKTEEHREEHWETLKFWIKQAEQYAEAGYWPMNKRNCWLCAFNRVCQLAPSQRPGVLAADFQKGPRWDPLHER